MKKPCDDCPFRRKSIPGWLGDASPEQFMGSVMADVAMPCHKTLDYDDPKWREKFEAQQKGELCAGSHVFFANICKLSRDRSRPRLPSNKKVVFSSAQEFIDHHNNGDFKSWEPDVDITADGTTVWVNGMNGLIGRLGPKRIDVHSEDTTHCLACMESPKTGAWEQFVSLMREHHAVTVPDSYRPRWA